MASNLTTALVDLLNVTSVATVGTVLMSPTHIPADFLVEDIRIDDRRHIVFATQKQLDQLEKAKTWYLDGTFKIVKAPFTQLHSIHAFARSGTCLKQIPLAFIFMSRKESADYVAVLNAFKRRLANPRVEHKLLSGEAKRISLQLRLISEKKLSRNHRTVYRQSQAHIMKLWEEYDGGLKTSDILRVD